MNHLSSLGRCFCDDSLGCRSLSPNPRPLCHRAEQRESPKPLLPPGGGCKVSVPNDCAFKTEFRGGDSVRPTRARPAGKGGNSLTCVTVNTECCLFSVSGLVVGLFRREEAARHSYVARESVHGDWSTCWTTAFGADGTPPWARFPTVVLGPLRVATMPCLYIYLSDAGEICISLNFPQRVCFPTLSDVRFLMSNKIHIERGGLTHQE
ncbi:unnamed protein product [Ectocarpus sp. 12 AP-2014]